MNFSVEKASNICFPSIFAIHSVNLAQINNDSSFNGFTFYFLIKPNVPLRYWSTSIFYSLGENAWNFKEVTICTNRNLVQWNTVWNVLNLFLWLFALKHKNYSRLCCTNRRDNQILSISFIISNFPLAVPKPFQLKKMLSRKLQSIPWHHLQTVVFHIFLALILARFERANLRWNIHQTTVMICLLSTTINLTFK